MATSLLYNTIKDPSGTVVPSVVIVARLKPGVGFRSDTTEIAAVVTTTANTSGYWSLPLERNAAITPAGSYWEIEEQIPDASGGWRVWAASVGASDASLFASLVTPSEASGFSTYLTQAQADARYAAIGAATTGFYLASTYGAVGDNLTDDTAAIQSAITAAKGATGGIVKFDAHSYLCASYLDLSGAHNVSLLGVASEGAPSGTILKFTGTYNSRQITVSTTASSTTITSSDAAFTSADVGSMIRIESASYIAGFDYSGVITAVTNATTATVSNTIARSVSSKIAYMGLPHIRTTTGSANGTTIANIRHEVASTGFYGAIDSRFNPGSSPAYGLWRDCFYGTASSVASMLHGGFHAYGVDMHRMVGGLVQRSQFLYGAHAVRMVGDWSHVDQCRFQAVRFAPLMNCNNACSFIRNTATPAASLGAGGSALTGTTTNASTVVTGLTIALTSNDVGATITGTGVSAGTTIASVDSATQLTLSAVAIASGTVILQVKYPTTLYDVDLDATTSSATFQTNWVGDGSNAGAAPIIRWAGQALKVEGNLLASGNTGITIIGSASSTATIVENVFSGSTSPGIAISRGDSSTRLKRLTLIGNNFPTVAINSGDEANVERIRALGNLNLPDQNYGTAVAGNVTPAIAAGAGAGTSPTISVTGLDEAGEITLTTGTTSGTGTLATVTFTAARIAAPNSVTLTPASAAAAANALQVYVSSVTSTTFVITANAAPTDATAYKWKFAVG